MKEKEAIVRRIKSRPEGMELQQLLIRMKNNWFWFALAAFLGLLAGLLYNSYTNPRYESNTTVLIKVEDKDNTLKSLYKELGINEKATSIQNQIGVLSSYNLNLRTMEKLNWSTTWYQNSMFKKIDLYGNPPFKVDMPDYSEQVKGMPIYIKPISDQAYQISYNSEAFVKGGVSKLKYSGEVKFGQAFVNEYFNFKINRLRGMPVLTGVEYVLVFNDLQKMAADFQGGLDIKLLDKDAELVNVKLEGENVNRTVDYLNALGNEYILFGMKEKDKMADNTVRFIDSLVSSIDSSLQAAGNEYTDFRTRNRVVDIGKETSLVIEKTRTIEEQEGIAKIKLDYYNNLKKYLKSPDKIKNLVAPSVVGVTDPTLNSLVLKLSELSSQREVQSYTLQERNPKLIALDKEITYTQNELAENINNLSANTQLELDNLTRQKNDVYQQQSTLPKKEQNYINIKRNFDLNNDLYNFLLQRRAEAGIMKASNEPQAQILDPARVDTSKTVGHYGTINLIIGIILGLVLAFLFILIKNYQDKTIHDVAEVNESLDLPVSGMIRHNKSASILPAYEFPDSEIAESFRELRLKLYFSANGTHDGKVVSVNSNISEEGKSFVSCNLATILAVDHKSVLLIDCDLRKPDVHNAFRVSNQKGLTNYLKNEAGFDSVLTKSNIENLTLLTTGPATDHPSELLNNGRLQVLLDEARKRYNFVLIKNPPSGLISDALFIQKLSDMNFYVLKFKYSTTRHIQYINDLAKLGMLKNMMVVLNNVSHTNGQGYGYYK